MKSVKCIGLAAVAIAALTAFALAGTASATVICKTEVNPCPAGWMVSSGETISASLEGSTAFETTGGETLDTCTGSSIGGPTEQTGSRTETVSIKFGKEKPTWSGCTATTETVSGGTIEFHWVEPWFLTVTAKELKFRFNIFGVNCTYGLEGTYKDIGTINLLKVAIWAIGTFLSKTEGGFLCPSEVRWTATYATTAPNSGNIWGTES